MIRAFVVFVAVLMPISLGVSAYVNTITEQAQIHVVSKERLLGFSGESGKQTTTYVNYVYSEDEMYVVSDNIFKLHFTSGTVYASIKEGATCDVTLSGIRFGLLSMFQNIIKADCK